jgi:hypothetical protein
LEAIVEVPEILVITLLEVVKLIAYVIVTFLSRRRV